VLPVAILAGGLGTRLADRTGGVLPKALVPVAGRPFIDHKLAELAAAGVSEVVLLVGSLAEPIERHVGDGSRAGLSVTYQRDGATLLGTGGALQRALPTLPGTFWVTYGDTLLDVDLAAAQARFDPSRLDAMMTVLENRDRWETSNVDAGDGLVTHYDRRPHPGSHAFIDYGMLLLTHRAFDGLHETPPFDLAPVLDRLIRAGRLGAYVVERRFFDIGTPEHLDETERFVRGEITR